jgi:hypothetical protein
MPTTIPNIVRDDLSLFDLRELSAIKITSKVLIRPPIHISELQ